MSFELLTILVALFFSIAGVILGFTIAKKTSPVAVKESRDETTPRLSEVKAMFEQLNLKINMIATILEKGVENITSQDKELFDSFIASLEELAQKLSPFEELRPLVEEMVSLKSRLQAVLTKPSSSFDPKILENMAVVISKINDKVSSLKSLETKLEKCESEKDAFLREITKLKSEIQALERKASMAATAPASAPSKPSVDTAKLKAALRTAREVNREAVKSDLIAMIQAVKDGKDAKALLKSIDKIALDTKELAVLLDEIIKGLGE